MNQDSYSIPLFLPVFEYLHVDGFVPNFSLHSSQTM
jgi:hypothetical protein